MFVYFLSFLKMHYFRFHFVSGQQRWKSFKQNDGIKNPKTKQKQKKE